MGAGIARVFQGRFVVRHELIDDETLNVGLRTASVGSAWHGHCKGLPALTVCYRAAEGDVRLLF